MEPPSSFCVVPWLHRHWNEQGHFQVCCKGLRPASHLHDENGEPLHVLDVEDWASLAGHPRLKSLRQAMLKGEWDPLCRLCQEDEAASGQSLRLAHNRALARHIPSLLESTGEDGAWEGGPASVDVRLGNHCNLHCRMCGPANSKLWTHHYNLVQPAQYRAPADQMQAFREDNWVRDPLVWERFQALLPGLERLHFAGGEPLIIPEMKQALRMCIEQGLASRIRLSYNTNLTVLPPDLGELWRHFHSVKILASIDGFGALNDFIRPPSRWQDVDRNLKLLDEHFHDWKLNEIAVHTTVQIYNVLELEPLYRYLRENFRHVLPAPRLVELRSPHYLSVRGLPPELKTLARERLLAEQRRPDCDHVTPLATISSVLQELEQEPLVSREQLIIFHRASERVFGDSLAAASPELHGYLRAHRLI